MPLDVDKGIELPQLELISTKNADCTTEYSTGMHGFVTLKYWLIVRTPNHVLYVSNVSRLARPNTFSISTRKEKKVWPS